ncbi:F-box protein At1g55000 isoform X2 [Phalaenopsis equestris]|uniref:F-box protein At1g55000 isoform X2 n=1 Tax=Phalaenopsis equestris TaxID=78828 RepID=UPI0009E2D050|nr:F-box protein At1g55000 isoform X2 [Phalaenopsis equestris]
MALGTSDLLCTIFELLSPADLARAACVCKLWKELASDRELVERAFSKPWKVRRVLGSPSTAGFWRHTGIDRFAVSHRLVRGDTVAGLAVNEIKRLNNMMSEHGIYSRERLLIPISDPQLLHESTCFIEFDDHANREVAVLYLEENPDGKSALPGAGFTDRRRGMKKLVDSVKRSLRVDDATAAYYLAVSNGDPRSAMLEFSEDLRWEQQR